MKRILVYAHYFYPDVASTGQILTELCEGLQDDFDITVICVVPSYDGKVDEKYRKKKIYREKHENINIVRVRVPEFDKRNKINRLENILTYFFNAIYATFIVGEQDLVFSISQPPILGGVLGAIGKWIKGAKFVYNIQDFNPEQTEVVGYSKNKMIIGIARTVDKYSCRCSDMIVVVGRDMQETLNKRFNGRNAPKSVVINNWIDETQVYPLPKDHPNVAEFRKRYGLEEKFVFMYSGNLGLYYDLENIIKVIGEFKDRQDVVFAFAGDGTVKKKLVNYAKDNGLKNIKFIPYQSKEGLIYSLNAADIHLVTNAKGIKGVSVPSKVYGALAVGRPILGILEGGSEARSIIEESNSGLCCEPGDYISIKKTLAYIINNKESVKALGTNGEKLLKKKYNKANSINKYIEILDSI